jgi:hypothetical protein
MSKPNEPMTARLGKSEKQLIDCDMTHKAEQLLCNQITQNLTADE